MLSIDVNICDANQNPFLQYTTIKTRPYACDLMLKLARLNKT